MKSCYDLINPLQHIKKFVEEIVRWLTFQVCAFRDHDKSLDSSNQMNFLELIKFLFSYNEEVCEVVLANTPQNASYVSPRIQKEIYLSSQAMCKKLFVMRLVMQSLNYCR